MIKFLRKLLLIDFVLSLFRTKQNPHLRFAGFLQVFAFLWLLLAVLLTIHGFNSESHEGKEMILFVVWIALCVGSFFFYRYTGRILKSYTEEEAVKFGYLRYLNPVAPVIYITTVVLLAVIILNALMLFLMAIGTLLFFLIILLTLGIVLLDKSYKLDNFISLPKAFFKAEDYFLDHVISPEVIIIFLLLIYFVIPGGSICDDLMAAF